MVHRCGIGTELAKCDIKLAVCILPVHPLDFDLLVFYFQGSYYIDRACQWFVLHLSDLVHFLDGSSDAE